MLYLQREQCCSKCTILTSEQTEGVNSTKAKSAEVVLHPSSSPAQLGWTLLRTTLSPARCWTAIGLWPLGWRKSRSGITLLLPYPLAFLPFFNFLLSRYQLKDKICRQVAFLIDLWDQMAQKDSTSRSLSLTPTPNGQHIFSFELSCGGATLF